MKKFSLLIILSILLLVAATGCWKQATFNGSRTSNDKEFIMEYSVLNDTKTHDMELEEGTIVDVIIQDKSGRLDVLVTNIDSLEEIYRGDNASTGNFSLTISKTGTYRFSVKGSKARGSVSFKVVE